MAARWLELVLDYRCNNRCVGCYAISDDGPVMLPDEAAGELARGRRLGITWLWLGGGEPTLRKDLFAIIREARRLGYERVKLQTNGMLLAYPEFTRRLVDAGLTEVAFSLKGIGEVHDRLTRTPGCAALVEQGVAHAAAAGLVVEGDVLLYAETTPELPELVRHYHALGLESFRLWLLSSAAASEPDVATRVPRLSDVSTALVRAMDLGLSTREDFIVSLHTPPCTLPESHHRALFFAPDLGLLVANPGGHRFLLEESPIEGGAYLPGCADCRWRPRCGGPRTDYLALHGHGEFVPATAP